MNPARKNRSYHLKEDTVIIIVGPTAVGKTAAAIRLAEYLHTDIISADSRQCFKELNIGVAKPSPEELKAVHHYFIDSHSIHEEVTAALFEELALEWTSAIFRARRTPALVAPAPVASAPVVPPSVAIMVGGTGLYIRAFCEGLDAIPDVDPAIRLQIQQQFEAGGIGWLQAEVRQNDPDFYQAGEILNPQRLMRALEVKWSTGQSILSFRTPGKKERPFRIRKIGLELPKDILHQRINDRVDQMMEQGLLDEVKSLLPFRENNALQTVGYRELFQYLDGTYTLEKAVEEIKKNTRRYAKRQLTWFRKDPEVHWIDARTPAALFAAL